MIFAAPDMDGEIAKLRALRDTLNASIAGGGHNTEDDLVRALDATEAELSNAGF